MNRLTTKEAHRITGTSKATKSSQEFWSFWKTLPKKDAEVVFNAGTKGRITTRLRSIPKAEKVVSAYLKGNESAREHWNKMVRKALNGKCPRCKAVAPKWPTDKLFEGGKVPAKRLVFKKWECEACHFAFVIEEV